MPSLLHQASADASSLSPQSPMLARTSLCARVHAHSICLLQQRPMELALHACTPALISRGLTVSPLSPMLAHPLRAFILFAAAATAGARLIVHACALLPISRACALLPISRAHQRDLKPPLKIKINRFCITFFTITGVKIHVLPLKISCRPRLPFEKQ